MNNYHNLSDQEKLELKKSRDQIHQAVINEPVKLSEHLQAFNDGVIAIIITIIVLDIKLPTNPNNYISFFGDILIFLTAFLIIADFWYDLHLDFSYFITRPGKLTAVVDLLLLADLSVIPVMVKWIMVDDHNRIAVISFGVTFLVAKVLRILTEFFGVSQSMHDSRIVSILMLRSSIRRSLIFIILTVVLIALTMVNPELAMIMYLLIPITSFVFPLKTRTGRYLKKG